MNAPLVPITIAFLVGILLGACSSYLALVIIVCILLTAGLVWRSIRARYIGISIVLVMWVVLGMLRVMVWQAHPDEGLRLILPEEPQLVRLHGVIADDPAELLSPNEIPAQRCVINLRHVRAWCGWSKIAGRVYAVFQDPRQRVAYGDELIVEGNWSLVPAPGNPGQYNWRWALARKRIHGLLRVRAFDAVVVLRQGQGNPVLAAVLRLRQHWERLIRAHFNSQDAGLLLGLLLGQRAEIGEDLKEAFTTTGTIHLLVISGFNVGIIACMFEFLLRLACVPWRLRLLISAIGLGIYALLTGMQPPVSRAMLMALVVLGAYALDRVISWPNTLCAAALVILLVDPIQLFDPGFQLSFGAVISLFTFTPRWYRFLEQHLFCVRISWISRYLAASLSATSAIWVGLSPVLAWYFQLVSPVSMLANLLLTPLMSALVSAGTFLLVAATFINPIMQLGSILLSLFLHMTLACVSWCHMIPFGYWFIGRPSAWFVIGYYLLICASIFGRKFGLKASWILIGSLAAIALYSSSAAVMQTFQSRWLQVDVIDVGNGDSILVRTPRAHALLIDAGSQEAGKFRVLPFLRSKGISVLDGLIITHPDEDHLGGAIPLMKNIRVKRIFTNGSSSHTLASREFKRLVGEGHIKTFLLRSGMKLTCGRYLEIEVLHPPLGLVGGLKPESNDNSIVLKVVRGAVSILLCGDLEEAAIPWLLRRSDLLRATVLKIPHHGSRLGQVGRSFFRAVQPRIAFLSVGRSRYLPSTETIREVLSTGAKLYSTRELGAISLRTDGKRLAIETFRTSSEK